MARWLEVTVTSQQRTSFGTGGERAYLTHTHPFLPGSVLRGALAAACLRSDGSGGEAFRRVFEFGRFGPAMPAWVALESQSVSKCKYHDSAAGHAEYVDLAFDLGQTPYSLDCCAARDQLKGAYTRRGLVAVVTTAQEPRKNTAATGQLFARETIERGTTFVGHTVLPDDTVADAGFETLKGIDQAFFGGRSTVLGRCTVTWKELNDPPHWPDAAPQAEEIVVVRTLSPTILVDEAGLPSIDFAGAVRAAVGVAPEATWAGRVESGLAGGWHSASGMPQPAEIAVAPGAVAALRGVPRERLLELITCGLGLRRNEGYGWVEIVSKPWQPPAEQPTRPTSLITAQAVRHGGTQWVDKIRQLSLDDAQTQWFANQLRRVRASQETAVQQAMLEPIARGLTPIQRDGDATRKGVKDLLLQVPNGLRASVATHITKGAAR